MNTTEFKAHIHDLVKAHFPAAVLDDGELYLTGKNGRYEVHIVPVIQTKDSSFSEATALVTDASISLDRFGDKSISMPYNFETDTIDFSEVDYWFDPDKDVSLFPDSNPDLFGSGGNVHDRGERQSPRESATLYAVGYRTTGQDGNPYIVKADKNGRFRWVKDVTPKGWWNEHKPVPEPEPEPVDPVYEAAIRVIELWDEVLKEFGVKEPRDLTADYDVQKKAKAEMDIAMAVNGWNKGVVLPEPKDVYLLIIDSEYGITLIDYLVLSGYLGEAPKERWGDLAKHPNFKEEEHLIPDIYRNEVMPEPDESDITAKNQIHNENIAKRLIFCDQGVRAALGVDHNNTKKLFDENGGHKLQLQYKEKMDARLEEEFGMPVTSLRFPSLVNDLISNYENTEPLHHYLRFTGVFGEAKRREHIKYVISDVSDLNNYWVLNPAPYMEDDEKVDYGIKQPAPQPIDEDDYYNLVALDWQDNELIISYGDKEYDTTLHLLDINPSSGSDSMWSNWIDTDIFRGNTKFQRNNRYDKTAIKNYIIELLQDANLNSIAKADLKSSSLKYLKINKIPMETQNNALVDETAADGAIHETDIRDMNPNDMDEAQMAEYLMTIDSDTWDKIGIDSGSTLYSNRAMQTEYKEELQALMAELPAELPKSMQKEVIDLIEDENYHSLFQHLYLVGFVTHENYKDRMLKMYQDDPERYLQGHLDPTLYVVLPIPDDNGEPMTVETTDTEGEHITVAIVEEAPKPTPVIFTDRVTGKSQQQITEEIRSLLDRNGMDKGKYSADDLRYLRAYEGLGGLAKKGYVEREILDQFFTPKNVIEKMWGLAYKHGYTSGRVLEPACGTARFLEYIPKGVICDAYEIDKYSHMICELTLGRPDFHFYLKSFETLFFDGNRHVGITYKTPAYQLVIGNPPYRDYASEYSHIKGDDHQSEATTTKANTFDQYFLMRSVDLLLPDGVLVFIMPNSFMNNGVKYNEFKELLASKCKLVDAYRLPNAIFPNTLIATDILVLKKNKY